MSLKILYVNKTRCKVHRNVQEKCWNYNFTRSLLFFQYPVRLGILYLPDQSMIEVFTPTLQSLW